MPDTTFRPADTDNVVLRKLVYAIGGQPFPGDTDNNFLRKYLTALATTFRQGDLDTDILRKILAAYGVTAQVGDYEYILLRKIVIRGGGIPIPGDTRNNLLRKWLTQLNAGGFILGTAPVITVQPANQTVTDGTNASFTVTATGTAPLAYQWKKNGVDIGGETAATLSFTPAVLADAGNYTVEVSNAFGSVLSNIAALTVNQTAGAIVANAWSAQVVTNGGAAPAAGSVTAVKNFWNALVTAGIDSKMIAVNIVAPDSVIAALTPIYKTAGNALWTNHLFVGGDLSVNGLIGDGGGKWAEPGFTPGGIWSGNDAGLSVYVHTGGSGNSVSMGVFDSSPTQWSKISGAGGGLREGQLFNNASEVFEVGVLTGFMTVNRTAANVLRLDTAKSSLVYGTRATSAVAGGAPSAGRPFYAWAQNVNGSVNNNTSERISFLAAHTGLTFTEGQAFYNAVQALRTALGGGFV